MIEYSARHHPHWEPVQFCGYHVRECGGTAVQEVAAATAKRVSCRVLPKAVAAPPGTFDEIGRAHG